MPNGCTHLTGRKIKNFSAFVVNDRTALCGAEEVRKGIAAISNQQILGGVSEFLIHVPIPYTFEEPMRIRRFFDHKPHLILRGRSTSR
ncbi:hypothetical protein MnTg02_01246 [bacterium MnTg02]|nr:hypothetical protein MnTg02_01246 [bacterium MnTg02]